MRKAILLLALAAGARADDDAVSKALGIAKAGPAMARERIPELIEISKRGPLERFAARDALVIAGPHAVAPLLEGASGDESLRLLLEGVSFDLGAGVVAPALPMLASEDPKIRAMAAVSLGAAGKGGEAAVKRLIEALYDKDAMVRAEAATALGRIGRGAHDAVPGLILLANDRERASTREALLALGMILRDAAERERRAPKVAPEVASAIEKGLAWLARQQRPDGWWEYTHDFGIGGPTHVARERASLTALVLLAMLEGAGKPPADVRAGLRCLAAADGIEGMFQVPAGFTPVFVAHCAGARRTGEPECRAAAMRGLGVKPEVRSMHYGWRALEAVEAGFTGLAVRGALDPRDHPDIGLGELALVGVVIGWDADSNDRFRTALELGVHEPAKEPESTVFAARARHYAGKKSDDLLASICASQREDGSWDLEGNRRGPPHSTACMLLCLEAASGLARPLTLPLPDAPQLRAAVATLRMAAQSQDAAIRAAAEQALAGFAVR
jgi:HEAT repeats